jgi:hypothetical protein
MTTCTDDEGWSWRKGETMMRGARYSRTMTGRRPNARPPVLDASQTSRVVVDQVLTKHTRRTGMSPRVSDQ